MLKRATGYREQLGSHFVKIADDPKYNYLNSGYWDLGFRCDETTQYHHQFVSTDEYENVIGYLEAEINDYGHYVSNISIVRFYEEDYRKFIFSRDLYKFLADLFFVYKYNKIEFCCATGSPNEIFYDKYTKKYGGRTVGVLREHFITKSKEKLDYKIYEIMRDSFMTSFYKINKDRKFIMNKEI